jgi:hypothetical protein
MKTVNRTVGALLVIALAVIAGEDGRATDAGGTCHPEVGFACITTTTSSSAGYEDSSCLPQESQPDCYTCEVAEGFHCIRLGISVTGYRDLTPE